MKGILHPHDLVKIKGLRDALAAEIRRREGGAGDRAAGAGALMGAWASPGPGKSQRGDLGLAPVLHGIT